MTQNRLPFVLRGHCASWKWDRGEEKDGRCKPFIMLTRPGCWVRQSLVAVLPLLFCSKFNSCTLCCRMSTPIPPRAIARHLSFLLSLDMAHGEDSASAFGEHARTITPTTHRPQHFINTGRFQHRSLHSNLNPPTRTLPSTKTPFLTRSSVQIFLLRTTRLRMYLCVWIWGTWYLDLWTNFWGS